MTLATAAALTLTPTLSAHATPSIQTWQTANGAKVLFVAAPNLPMVDIRVVFAAGSARDGAQFGLAALTSGLLAEGAGPWNADVIAERIEMVGGELNSGIDRDMAWVNVRSLIETAALATVTDTVAQVLGAPHFAAADLERVRHNRLVALRQAEQDPATVGSKLIFKAIFGEHPYAHDPDGTAATLTAVQQADVQAFYRRYYVAENAVVAIVGALDRAQAEQLATQMTAHLPRGEAAAPLPAVPQATAGSMNRINFPSSQTHLFAGQVGMKRGDPDYFTLYVGNHILGGGGLVSLLTDAVREQRGLSYSVYSHLLPLAQPGPFLLGLQTQNAQADEAQTVLLDTLRRFINDGPTPAQLDAAIKNLTGGFPLRIASNKHIVQYLAVIGFYDLPLDYLDRFTDRIRAVTAQDIKTAFQKRIHPDQLQIVLVGAAAKPMAK
ncbi:M16 family metallopeptidase [Thiospirillum jenense]|uniref:Insulinase family protein n=1 Tax=Thiospirillum jenense TaxID=1653858 RepID=A0A839HD40_9GAMM|nr:pitrilysin family protein [Thiospirillum jenense]MBB1125107.1 insulinase family protein [Thiospirillum jenense]